MVMGIYGIGAIFGSLTGGRFTDKIGFYKVQIFTLVFGGLTFIILGQLKSYYAICICMFVLAFINEAFRPANSAAIARFSTEENRIRSFSLVRLSFNLGWAIGAGLAGLIASYSYQFLFWIDGVTNILAAILLWKLLPFSAGTKLTARTKDIPENNSAYTDKTFLLFIGISIIYVSCFFQLFSNLTAYFKNELHFSERVIGLLLSWNGMLIVLIEMALIFWIEKNWTKKKSITIGVLLHVVAYLIILIFKVNMGIAFLMMTFITLSEMFAFSVMVSFWMERANENNQGQYAGIWTMSWAISQSIGPFLGSVAAQYFGFNYLWMIVAMLSGLAAFLYSRLIKN